MDHWAEVHSTSRTTYIKAGRCRRQDRNYIFYTFQRAGFREPQRFGLRISKRLDQIHVRIARAWLPQETRRLQTPEEVEREALQSQPWRALQNWIMSGLDTREHR
jgi:hypothetical protein